MSCPICGQERCLNPSFCRSCREADARHRREPNGSWRRLGDSISIDRAYAEINTIKGCASSATVEALTFQLRSGVSALKEPETRRRLSELTDQQLIEVVARLQRLKPEIAPAWSDDAVETLLRLRETLR